MTPATVRRRVVLDVFHPSKRRPTRPPDRGLFFMSHRKRRTAVAGACAAVVATGLIPLATAQAQDQSPQIRKTKAGHVLLISVDGLHQSDLAFYVSTHPKSALASLVDRGTSYTAHRLRCPPTPSRAWSRR